MISHQSELAKSSDEIEPEYHDRPALYCTRCGFEILGEPYFHESFKGHVCESCYDELDSVEQIEYLDDWMGGPLFDGLLQEMADESISEMEGIDMEELN